MKAHTQTYSAIITINIHDDFIGRDLPAVSPTLIRVTFPAPDDPRDLLALSALRRAVEAVEKVVPHIWNDET
jgi:hypothetical protein